ncbi:MAG TPA: ABC transporter ATP-binding protein [bacterium]|nr:ABC transporter ATP-binding protein [bacterium]
MSDTIISANNIGKKYIIRHNQEAYLTLRDQIAETSKTLAKKIIRPKVSPKKAEETFWALKGLSFEIKQGERVGIIGRNGAGKSTLLKILSRITEPTTGEIRMEGRVASLLEVGTGFHPELTGRENVYLNGAILGMSKKEIARKFDEIVQFAEVERFLDTPVKRYSSGMYVRLAFAVAAHLEPKILIVDEVLAVGDTQFQKKCLGKMDEVARGGRTVLFVSHNMSAISGLCEKCILLDGGKIVSQGETSVVIKKYLKTQQVSSDGKVDLRPQRMRKSSLEDSKFKFTDISILNSKQKISSHVFMNEPFTLVIKGEASEDIEESTIGYNINSSLGFPLFNSFSPEKRVKKGSVKYEIDFSPNILAPGIYAIGLGANGEGIVDWIPEAINLTVDNVTSAGKSNHAQYDGVVIYPYKWQIK